MLKKIFSIICISLVFNCFSQENIAQLKHELNITSDQKEQTEILLKICDLSFENKTNTIDVIDYATQLATIANNTSDNILLAKAYGHKSRAQFLAAKYEESIDNAEKSIQLFTDNELFIDAAIIKKRLGNIHQAMFNNKEALHNFTEAEQYLPEKEKITLYIGLGAVSTQTNNLDKALAYYDQAFNIANKLALKKFYYNIYGGIAGINIKNGDYLKAIEFYKKALESATTENDYLGQTICYHNIGESYKAIKDYQSSKKYYELSMTFFDKISQEHIKASTYLNYSSILVELDLLEDAEKNLIIAENLFKKLEDVGRIPNILNTRASIERKKGNPHKAIDILIGAINNPKIKGMTEFTQHHYLYLSELYEELNQPYKAIKALKEYQNIKDSIASINQTAEIEALKIKFDINSYEQDLKLKTQELLSAKAKKKMSSYRFILLAVVTLSLILFIYRQRKLNNVNKKALLAENEVAKLKEEQFYSEMKYKNSQITEYAIHINDRNKFLDSCIDRVKNIRKLADKKETRDLLTDLQFYITENIDINKEKVELNKRAKGTEESFVYELKKLQSKLTSKETKVATYLVLGLTSKSIANQMGINQQSVNNYRFSLRKKLNLSKEDDLVLFLKKIINS